MSQDMGPLFRQLHRPVTMSTQPVQHLKPPAARVLGSLVLGRQVAMIPTPAIMWLQQDRVRRYPATQEHINRIQDKLPASMPAPDISSQGRPLPIKHNAAQEVTNLILDRAPVCMHQLDILSAHLAQ